MLTLFKVPIKKNLVLAFVVLSGCKNADKNCSLILDELNESLENSNRTAKNLTNVCIRELEDYLNEGVVAYKAKYWLDKADTIRLLSDELVLFIDTIKIRSEKKDDENFRRELKLFFNKLRYYHSTVLNLEPKIKNEFESRKVIINKKYLSKFRNENEFAELNFNQFKTSILRNRILQFENDVRITESDLVVFCKSQFIINDEGYTITPVLISQNKSHVYNGEKLIVKAGIGSFYNLGNPVFVIDGKVIKSKFGFLYYEITAKGNLGIFKVPINIEYTDVYGERVTYNDFIEYTVDK